MGVLYSHLTLGLPRPTPRLPHLFLKQRRDRPMVVGDAPGVNSSYVTAPVLWCSRRRKLRGSNLAGSHPSCIRPERGRYWICGFLLRNELLFLCCQRHCSSLISLQISASCPLVVEMKSFCDRWKRLTKIIGVPGQWNRWSYSLDIRLSLFRCPGFLFDWPWQPMRHWDWRVTRTRWRIPETTPNSWCADTTEILQRKKKKKKFNEKEKCAFIAAKFVKLARN